MAKYTAENNYGVNVEKHIWEGWRVIDFINQIEPTLEFILSNHRDAFYCDKKPFKSRDDFKTWVKMEQPYYSKYIPGVVSYFARKYAGLLF